MAKGNPNPVQTPKFKKHQFRPYGEVDQPLGSKVWGLRLPVDVEARLKTMPDRDRVDWMRKTLVQAARKELMN